MKTALALLVSAVLIGWALWSFPISASPNLSCSDNDMVVSLSGTPSCSPNLAPAPVMVATTGSIGGGLLALSCTTSTVNVTGATNAMSVAVSPTASPGGGVQWQGYVSSPGVVTVQVCALISLTLSATTYNVRVIP